MAHPLAVSLTPPKLLPWLGADVTPRSTEAVAPKRTIKLPYVIRRADSPGFHFSRKIPRDVAHHFARTHWRWKLGNTEAEARIKLADAIQQTEQIIEDLRAGKEPTREATSPEHKLWKELVQHYSNLTVGQLLANQAFIDQLDTIQKADLEKYGQTVPRHDYAQMLVDQADQARQAAEAVTYQQLLDLAVKLVNPANNTLNTWKDHVRDLERRFGPNANELTREQVKGWRDEWLALVSEGKRKKTTLKNRFGTIQSWYRNAIDEGWLKVNPFDGVLRNIGSDRKVKVDWLGKARAADELVPTKLNAMEQQIYWIIRWSGMRLAEACGLRISDIHLEDGYLSVFPYEDGVALRDVKNTNSHRHVPIHHKLRPVLEQLVAAGAEYPFLKKYNPKTHRWGSGLAWTKQVGLSPHRLRHAVHTSLRNHRVDDYTQRVIVGHGSADVHTAYGSQEFQVAFDAVQLID